MLADTTKGNIVKHPIFGNLIEMYDIKKKIHVSPYSTGSAMLRVGSVRLLYTNMLVSATRNTCVGGQSQCEPPTQTDVIGSGI